MQIDAFVQDFSAALDRAQSLDENIINDAGKISSNYVDLVSLAARQVMGSMDITVLQSNGGGSLNESDVKIFIKDIGGDTTGYASISLSNVLTWIDCIPKAGQCCRKDLSSAPSIPLLQCLAFIRNSEANA